MGRDRYYQSINIYNAHLINPRDRRLLQRQIILLNLGGEGDAAKAIAHPYRHFHQKPITAAALRQSKARDFQLPL